MTKIRNFIFNIFIGGFIVLLPIIIIFHIAQWLFNIFEQNTQPLTKYMTGTFSLSEPMAMMFSLVTVFIVFSVIGMIVRTQMGGSLYAFVENVTLNKIPGYITIKDIIAQITGKQKGLFRKVVLVKLSNTEISLTGFIVDELSENHSTVFIPCGPNPTTGFIVHVNNEAISVMDISVETAMKSVISCGSGSSQFVPVTALINQSK